MSWHIRVEVVEIDERSSAVREADITQMLLFDSVDEGEITEIFNDMHKMCHNTGSLSDRNEFQGLG